MPHSFQSPFVSNITLMDIPWMNGDNFVFSYQDGDIFDSFVQQGSFGNLGILQLTPYQGRYFWAPIFQADNPTDIFVENVRGFSINPVCRQLNNTELGVPYLDPTTYGDKRTVRLGPFNATIPGLRGHLQYWGFFADGKSQSEYEDRETIQIYSLQANIRREFGAPTFEFNTHKSYIYAVTCNVTAEAWNITGYLSSLNRQRLYNIQSVTRLSDVGATYLWWTLRGLDHWTKTELADRSDNDGRGLHSMMWMWIQGQKYTDHGQEVPLIDIPIVDGTRQKLTEIIAATLTTATASIQPRAVRGAYLIETSIITVSVPKLIGGLMIQLSYISIIVGLYIFMRKSKVYRSDDITYLFKKDAVEIGRRM
ncbi:hypothetical protein BGW42_002794 [Actinomortierella wolfii]|nr:hypothetical protein BGW42_002794 [Actinomortierella wolfii]